MSNDPVGPRYIPSLFAVLVNAEHRKGALLTQEEVESLRDQAVCIMLPASVRAKMDETSGPDLDPARVWDEWQSVRPPLQNIEQAPPAPRMRYFRSAADVDFHSLPLDEKERHERFIEMFGKQVFSIRNQVLERVRGLIEAPQSVRDEMGTIYAKEYDGVAGFSADQRDAAMNLARKTVDVFLREILGLLAHNGLSQQLVLGARHAFAFELVMQVLELSELTVIEEHTINKGGQKHFPDYYARWLNRYKEA